MRVYHYSIRTEKSYWYWIRYFIRFHQLRHPLELGAIEVKLFSPGWPLNARWPPLPRIWRSMRWFSYTTRCCSSPLGTLARWCVPNARRVFHAC
nr:phage integrase N-terminal SAM-like domain-containing protein [Pseudomonas alcaliphila]